jgi:hypothetical protein
LFEAARAHCAADERLEVTVEDMAAVATMAMRFRQSEGLGEFYSKQEREDGELRTIIEEQTMVLSQQQTTDQQ